VTRGKQELTAWHTQFAESIRNLHPEYFLADLITDMFFHTCWFAWMCEAADSFSFEAEERVLLHSGQWPAVIY